MSDLLKKFLENKNLVRMVILGVLIFAVLLTVVLIIKGYVDEFNGSASSGKEIVITVRDIDGIDTIAERLQENGVIHHSWLFSLYVGTKSTARGFRTGEITFVQGDSYAHLLETALKPAYVPPEKRAEITIRFREGMEVSEIVEKFIANGIGDEEAFANVLSLYDFGYDYIPAAKTPNRMEGFLFPDTYNFYADSTVAEALQKMVDTFDKRVMRNEEVRAMAESSGMNFYDLVTLASIVEAEAGNSSEMPLVASVFVNRIAKEMKLQSCATFNYTVPRDQRSSALTNEQIASTDPYNSYRFKGLPPTPICNPSLSAIKAAAAPADTNYLFFCSKGSLGGSAFAATEAEHEKNIATYKQYW